MAFKDTLHATQVASESLGVFWLGQAGFLFKTPGGKVIVVDPYLSDYVYKILGGEYGNGFKRMTAPLFDPGDIEIDYLFASHEHGDHLDVDALQLLLKDGKTPIYTNTESARIMTEAGAPKKSVHVLHKGETHDFGEFKLTITAADHGDLCPDALGFIFDFGFVRVYYSGDTAYTKTILQQAIDAQPEIVLLPINGAFGNLNAEQAAQFANDLSAKACMPHHFWTFPLHNGDKGSPMDAIEAFPKYAPGCELIMRYPGEAYIYTKR